VTEAISARDLRKSYGALQAVDGVSFEVHAGEFFGILGPNGAGKTHHAGDRRGLRRPDAGTVSLLGRPAWPRDPVLLPRIGVQLQASSFFERLTAREQLRTFAARYRVPPAVPTPCSVVAALARRGALAGLEVKGGTLEEFSSIVQQANLAVTGRPPAYHLATEQVEDKSLKAIQYVAPGLLGWAVASGAAFGAATTLVS